MRKQLLAVLTAAALAVSVTACASEKDDRWRQANIRVSLECFHDGGRYHNQL